MSESITVTCPTCKGPSVFSPSNHWRPFCSERCKVIDLGRWAGENYRIPIAHSEVETTENEENIEAPRAEG